MMLLSSHCSFDVRTGYMYQKLSSTEQKARDARVILVEVAKAVLTPVTGDGRSPDTELYMSHSAFPAGPDLLFPFLYVHTLPRYSI